VGLYREGTLIPLNTLLRLVHAATKTVMNQPLFRQSLGNRSQVPKAVSRKAQPTGYSITCGLNRRSDWRLCDFRGSRAEHFVTDGEYRSILGLNTKIVGGLACRFGRTVTSGSMVGGWKGYSRL
jgi:hypothetical protein